jgi:hypothetical protein
MASTHRTDAQRAASRQNGARSSGPRTAEGRTRSSANRTTHGLNSVRLLLATEDIEEYRQHLLEWTQSLAPASAAEHQIVQLLADLVWRLKRVGRIEDRRALAILEELVEQTPEWKTKAQAQDLLLGLDTIARLVESSALPVPTSNIGGFVAGVRGVEHLVELLRSSLAAELWPETEAGAFLGAAGRLAEQVGTEVTASEAFTAVGLAASMLGAAVRALIPDLQMAVERARLALSTETLLVDDEDRRFERHRRILEASVARQLDLLSKVRALVRPAASLGSFERAPQVELRIVRV